jgi:hypothetical protein
MCGLKLAYKCPRFTMWVPVPGVVTSVSEDGAVRVNDNYTLGDSTLVEIGGWTHHWSWLREQESTRFVVGTAEVDHGVDVHAALQVAKREGLKRALKEFPEFES